MTDNQLPVPPAAPPTPSPAPPVTATPAVAAPGAAQTLPGPVSPPLPAAAPAAFTAPPAAAAPPAFTAPPAATTPPTAWPAGPTVYAGVAPGVPPFMDPAPKRRRPVGLIVTVALLGLLLAAALGGGVWYFLQLQDATATIREQQRELEEQRELIERKDTFGAAMNGLLDEVGAYEGVPLASLIPWDRYELLASQAWARRWNPVALDESIAAVETARQELATQREAAEAQAASNDSGTAYEAAFDSLGHGYVTWIMEDADAFCEEDVIACVSSDDPLLVHVDAADDALPYTNDWLRTGTAYHEFAHVLQFTNPEPTETALASFRGDVETMADCFALTFLDGWTLDHTIWVNSYEYWEVSVGYGYSCTDTQRQVVRDWYAQLGVHSQQIGA